MTSVTQIARALRRVLGGFADEAAVQTGFVQRVRKLSGSRFAQALVFGWLGDPGGSLSHLTQAAAAAGVQISNQGLDQRFTMKAAVFMREILQAAVGEVVAADPVAIPLLQRFPAVVLQDSSVVVLPNALAEQWRGNGSRTGDGAAAVKLQVRLNLKNGGLTGPLLADGRRHDRNSSIQALPLPVGALRIADLGFFSLRVLGDLQAKGDFYLTRLRVGTAVFDEAGIRLDLLRRLRAAGEAAVDIPIQLGVTYRLPCRLLVVPVPIAVAKERRRRLRRGARQRGQTLSKEALALADWTILVTNVSDDKLSLDEALVLMHARWQIELLFKLWKQHGRIDEWRSANPWRILCEFYAKLVAVVIQHWLTITSLWAYPDRSLVKAVQTVRSYALALASAIAGTLSLVTVIKQIHQCLRAGCRMNSRKARPNTYQLLLQPTMAA